MNDVVTVEKSIKSCYDFELQIERKFPLSFRYSYKKKTELKGIVFIISGFGEDTNNGYLDNLRTYTAKTFDVVCINVFYHCFYSRPRLGAKISPDEIDEIFLKKYFEDYGINHNSENIDSSLQQLDDKIDELKKSGEITQDAKVMVPATIFPTNDEYQNFGVMQALDHINVLHFIQNASLSFKKNYSTAVIGSSHGGYIAHLCAKFAPNSIDLVIDNSSYAKPHYKYFLGRESNSEKPEYTIDYRDHIKIYSFVKTHWSLDKNSQNFFSSDHYRIRDISDSGHLVKLSDISTKKTKYISYHSAYDGIAPIAEKERFYEMLSSLGFDATLHIISDETGVDGRFIKHLNHGMDMSLKELINRELPKMDTLGSSNEHKIEKISYDCDTIRYTFDFKDAVFCGEIEPLKETLSIEELATENFLKNISYLERNQPDVFKKLSALDSAVEQNLYVNRYDLFYKNGSFDVAELATSKHLYNSSSDEYGSMAANSINFDNSSNAFETFRKLKIADEDLPKYKKVSIFQNNLSGYADILNYVQKNKNDEKLMQKIEKFIFFGVGLGTHILKIDAKISAKTYFIIEDDLELFRLSLFTAPYYKLAQKSKLLFSVFDSKQEFSGKAANFLTQDFYYNHYLKYFHMLNHVDEKFWEFHIQIASQSHNLFFYNAILEQQLRPLDYLQNRFKFINILRDYSDKSLGNKPVILLAAGPSLQKNIEWLKQNRDKFIIVALSAVLSILEKEQIKPDIVTHIDGLEESIIHFTKLKDISFFDKTLFLISSRTPREIVDILKKQNIFFFESSSGYKKEFGNLSAPCVGSTTYLLLLALGVSKLYLLGLDLALDSKTGQTHSGGHEYSKNLEISGSIEEKDSITFKHSVIPAEGNFEQKVYTTPEFLVSISSINAASTSFKKSTQHVYNLSDGAKFSNTVPTNTESLSMNTFVAIDKEALYKETYKEFEKNSSSELSIDEYMAVEDKIKHSKNIRKVIEEWQKLSFKESDEFLDSLAILIKELCSSSSNSSYDLALVLQEYLKFISTFIFDFFNTKNLQNIELHTKSVRDMLCWHLLDIVDLYIDGLSSLPTIKG